MPDQSTQNPSFLRYLGYWGPVVLYALAIFFLSAQSAPGRLIPGVLYHLSDKVLHGLEYGIFAILLYRAFKYTVQSQGSMNLAILAAVAYGLSDELHQWFVPNRQADLLDLFADGLGAAFLLGGWVWFTETRKLRHNRPQASSGP